MPHYSFQNPNNPEEIKDVFFHMLEDKKYIENDIEWLRVFLPISGRVDTRIDPFSKKRFMEKTKTSRTVGEIADRSEEMGQKRANKLGYDPHKENYYKRYEKKTGGKDHPDIMRKKAKEKLNKMGVDLV